MVMFGMMIYFFGTLLILITEVHCILILWKLINFMVSGFRSRSNQGYVFFCITINIDSVLVSVDSSISELDHYKDCFIMLTLEENVLIDVVNNI
jgi:hypothetical protein